jgi:succinyl-diaminopimelate desuccinylase
LTLEAGVERAVSILKRLIAIPTVSPQGEHYEEAAELLAKELESVGMDKVEVIRVPSDYQKEKCKLASSNPRFIVYGRIEGETPTLHFNGHYDVVPGGPGWTVTEPFKPVEKDGKIYGRGAVDMKGGIAAVIGALSLVSREVKERGISVEAAFVPDEEIGGHCGTGYLVETMEKVPEYVVLPEPSGLERPWHGHRGILWVKVKVKGRTAHASTPWLGSNAFLAAARLALELHSILSSIYSQRASKYPIDPEDARMPTAMIGGVAGVPGGGKTNQVPGEFEFTIDRRLIPEENVRGAWDEIRSALRWASMKAGAEAEASIEIAAEPAINDPGPLLDALKEAAREAGREVGDPVVCPGGLDMWYYTVRGSRALAYGPSYHLAHAPDEHISVDELRFLVAVFSRLPFKLAAKAGRET